jgi:membrane associated rhomboid family serine protease
MGFQSPKLVNKLQFNASKIIKNKEYYRLVSHAFVHANWEHLIVNMIVLLSFGQVVEKYFGYYFGNNKGMYFIFLYVGGILFSNLYALVKHRNNYFYNAVGASGAVAAVLFAAIFFDPWSSILFFGILPIPGIIFGGLYLFYSYYMSRKESDNIAHDAHFLGSVFGFFFPVLLNPLLFETFSDKLFMII